MDRKEGRFVGRKLLCRYLYTEHRGILSILWRVIKYKEIWDLQWAYADGK